LRQRVKANPFFQVDGFCDTLSNLYSTYYNLGQFIDVDKMSIYFKGRHKCCCYNPNKPEKWHLKSFCLNNADTGYLFNFYLYHSAEVRPLGVSATAHPVIVLTTNNRIHYRNHILCLDNWYTSIDLAVLLMKQKGIHIVGTIKGNRKGLPTNLFPYTGRYVKPRGEMASNVNTIDGVTLWLTEWQDNTPVRVLST
jgi:hypothetical protein